MELKLKLTEHAVPDYERVLEVEELKSGLRAIIAIHNTTLGPALGGARVYPYATFEEGMTDALRLARGMTYKASIAQTGTGGGKSVIFADYTKPKSPELLRAFAEAVNALEGHYICAEDLGMNVNDLRVVCETTPYAVGLPTPKSSGDPSRFTSFGGFRGIQAVCQHLWGTDSPANKTFAIQGLGAVGWRIAEHLFWHGARLIVTDVSPARVQAAVKEFGAQDVAPEEILMAPCDVMVPCALGGILNPATIPQLKCQAVAGLANNQLLSPQDGESLHARGILYAPDYVINSGGLLAVCCELNTQGFDPVQAREEVDRLYHVLLKIFKQSKESGQSPDVIADQLAEQNLQNKVGYRTQEPVFHSLV